MSSTFTESVIEQAALAWLESLGYQIVSGPEIAPGEMTAERENYGQVVLERRLRQALQRLNRQVPSDALEEAFRKLTRPDSPSLVANNHALHKMLVEGITVESSTPSPRPSPGGRGSSHALHGDSRRYEIVKAIDFDDPAANEFLAVNQFTVTIDRSLPSPAGRGGRGVQRATRRADIVLFINGLPVAVIELKNAATENATIWSAFNQLQTYKRQIPSLFAFNEALVISDGVQARIGTLTADREWFMPWRAIEGEELADTKLPQLQVVLEGVFQKRRFLDLIRHFIVFEDVGGGELAKKMAGYHQYHAVNVAVQETIRACIPSEKPWQVREGEGTYFAKGHPDAKPGDRRVGVVWHTQGSGKSLTMAFYAGRVVLHPAMENPTLVVITDRNDLDDQLYGTFARCHELLRQQPVQAQSRANLRELLTTASGGVVFTTVHKFMPAAPSPQSSPSGRGSYDDGDYRGGFVFSGLVERARELRQLQAPAEEILWQLLCDPDFAGLKFRRQHQIGDFIVDFYCDELKLVVELDGDVRGELSQAVKDERRQAWLEAMGFIVIRFPNKAILDDTESVLTDLAAYLPSTSRRGAGGEGPLSHRKNIVVIADEAHRSQYDFIDDFARHMREALPNASFIGFTGTPIELTDKNTRAVFGEYISIYDIERAVKDGATVPIYYESRLAKLELEEAAKPLLDEEFEEATEGEEVEHKERLKTKWAQLEALVGTEKRLNLIAEDLVRHFETRLEAMDGKAMIVCMSRRICVELYKAITAIRPDWHSDNDAAGIMKIVMTGSASDPAGWQGHIRNKPRREELAKRFKDPKDPFKVVIVRDMWLTGFDAPCLHTMYVDKPMRGHGLMQAIARVNRVFKDKPGGLVVDYLGLADQIKYALANYTESGGKGQTAINQVEAVAAMQERYEVCCGMFHGFDWAQWKIGGPRERLSLLPAAQEHVLAQNDGKNRLVKAVSKLSKTFALAVPHEKALAIRDDVTFFQSVRSVLTKGTGDGRRSPEAIELAIRQIVSKAVSSDEVIDIFAAAGLKKPDISILSDEFLAEVRGMPQRNLAVEMLRKLLEGEIKARGRKNVVQARSFAELLEAATRKYQNRAIETAQVIEELIRLAQDMREATRRGEVLGLTEDEVAFYDALEVNDSAVAVLGDETLRLIAQELVKSVRNSITIDWTVRENVRAQMRVIIKRILRKYGYPPDKQARATELVLEQAEVLCVGWSK